jgi:hypothetical protein
MQTALPMTKNDAVAELHDFTFLIAYDAMAHGKRAINMCERLMANLTDTFRFHVQLVQFKNLERTASRKTAESLILGADMVVVSCAGETEFSPEVREWIESWLLRKGEQSTALVELIDKPLGTSPAHSYLQAAARRGTVDFFPSAQGTATTSPPQIEATENTSPQSITRVQRWGLNE